MRKYGLFAVAAAAVLFGLAAVAATTRARFEPAAGAPVDTSQMTQGSQHLPPERWVDFALVFE